MKTYTLAELERVTDAKRRSVQLWADRGVIQAEAMTEGAGSGVHRQFRHDEAIIACIISAFAKRQSPIGRLLRISHQLRRLLELDWHRSQVMDALAGRFPVFLIVRSYGRRRPLAKSEIIFGPIDTTDAKLEVSIFSFSSHKPTALEEQKLGFTASEMLNDPNSFTEILRIDTYLVELR